MTTPHRAPAVALLAAAGLAAGPATAAHAQEAPVDDLRPGKSVLLVHDADFVGVFGYAPGSPVRVQVLRGGQVVAAAHGPAVTTAEGPGLEVNHGPVGAARAGDCWDHHTPDVRPGDRIVVTGDGGQDVVAVDDIAITRGAYTPTAEELAADPTLRDGDVVVEGRARHAGGTPIPVAALDSAEVRANGGSTRATPNVPVARLGDPAGDGWRAIYRAPGYGVFRGSPDRLALLAGDHAMGYGHTPVPPPPVAQLVEGSAGGPAPGCEAAPAAPPNAVTALSDAVVNVASGDLTVGGVAGGSVAGVVVTLDDGPAGGDPVVVAVPADRLTAGPGPQAWSADVPRDRLERLRDGTLSVTATFDGAAGPGALTLAKDVVAPGPIVATPPAGRYTAPQVVTLGTGDGADRVRYTRDGSAPTPASLQAGRSISVSSTQTITAVAADAAGNTSAVGAFAYEIGPEGTTTGSAFAPVLPGAPLPPGAPAAAPAPPALVSLVSSARVKRSRAARHGLRLVMRLGERSGVVRIRVHRRTGTARRLVWSGLRTPASAGLYRVQLRERALRRALRPGTYEVEATPGPSRAELGRTSKVRIRVVQ